MKKLNDYIAHFKQQHKQLDGQNFNINSEINEILINFEKEAVQLELYLDRLMEEKNSIVEQIEENERQILLWEKKTILEKEMQKALDPNIGKKEILELEKIIHLKSMELKEIVKQHEMYISNIQKMIDKKENIALKYQKRNQFENMMINGFKQ